MDIVLRTVTLLEEHKDGSLTMSVWEIDPSLEFQLDVIGPGVSRPIKTYIPAGIGAFLAKTLRTVKDSVLVSDGENILDAHEGGWGADG
jgi:hypothetical protein